MGVDNCIIEVILEDKKYTPFPLLNTGRVKERCLYLSVVNSNGVKL